MFFQSLVDINRINYKLQEKFFEVVMSMQKMRLKEIGIMMYIYKYTCTKIGQCNIMCMGIRNPDIIFLIMGE